MSDRDKILEKVKKLMALQEGTTFQGELEAAAARVKHLLIKHNLSLVDVEAHKLKSNIAEVGFNSEYSKLPTYMKTLSAEIAVAYDCDIVYGWWFDEDLKYGTHAKRTFSFIGLPADAEVAQFMFLTLYDKLNELAEHEANELGLRRTLKIEFKNNFIVGAAVEIRKRLQDEQAVEMEEDVKTNEMVLLKRDALDKYMKEQYPDIKPIGMGSISMLGYEEGKEAGRNIPLTKGMPDVKAKKSLPGG